MKTKQIPFSGRSESAPIGRDNPHQTVKRRCARGRPSSEEVAAGDSNGLNRRTSAGCQAGEKNCAFSAEERQLIILAVNGFTNKDIACYLCLSESAICRRMARIRNRLGAANRFELVLAAVDGEYSI